MATELRCHGEDAILLLNRLAMIQAIGEDAKEKRG
jgi:hypothetical protein